MENGFEKFIKENEDKIKTKLEKYNLGADDVKAKSEWLLPKRDSIYRHINF
jgi:hypothetical protein